MRSLAKTAAMVVAALIAVQMVVSTFEIRARQPVGFSPAVSGAVEAAPARAKVRL
jgi:hypothetical protein